MSTPTKDFSKLTVPQLKALCKEHRITGYSKLGKNALLQKLDHVIKKLTPDHDVPATAPLESSNHTSTVTAAVIATSVILAPPLGTSGMDQVSTHSINASVETKKIDTVSSPSRNPQGIIPAHPTMDTSAHATECLLPPSVLSSVVYKSVARTKRPLLPPQESSEQPHKKYYLALQTTNDGPSATQSEVPDSAHGQYPISASDGIDFSNKLSSVHHSALKAHHQKIPTSTASTRQFKPLVIQKRVGPVLGTLGTCLPPKAPGSRMDDPRLRDAKLANGPSFFYLDVPLSPPVSLPPISLPPKMSQRKYVQRWAVLLSALTDRERKQCTLVSRMLRYAVYLSAAERLAQGFAGDRLTLVKQMYPANMTNMWPYLRLREEEASVRRCVYKNCFLAKSYSAEPISERLWASPNNEKQVIIALRFLTTLMWFLVSVGGGQQDLTSWTRGKVTDAQEIIKNEIWSITYSRQLSSGASQCQTFYALESTCEVVGRPSPAQSPECDALPLRADWSTYIAHRILPLSPHQSPLFDLSQHLQWTNHEEYHKGISRIWLKRIATEASLGLAKKVVAERYILASVVSNSISGSWMSSVQMEQDFAGLPLMTNPVNSKANRIHLFLPAHHLVESVHFTSADGGFLHPALAVVQTPGREYYILKDNGMQVGCEEDGVADVWMKIVKCTNKGIPV